MRKQDEQSPWLQLLISILQYVFVTVFMGAIGWLMSYVYARILLIYSKVSDSVANVKNHDKRTGEVALFFNSGLVKVVLPEEVTDEGEYAEEVALFAKAYPTKRVFIILENRDKSNTIVYVDGKVVKIKFKNAEME